MRRASPTLRLLAPLLAVALLVSARPGRARPADRPPLRSATPPVFTADLAISLDAEGRPALSVLVTVPYAELQWVRLERGYGAGLEIGVSLEPTSRGRRVYGDVWERTLAVSTFEGTISPAAVVETRTFHVPPGHYAARVTVRDLSAGEASSAGQRTEVPDYSRVPLGLSDLDLGFRDSTGRFYVVPSREFGTNARRLAARVALFDRRPGSWPRRYPLRYRVLDEQGGTVLTGTQEATLGGSAEPVLVVPGPIDLFLGGYVFELDLGEGRSRWRVTRSFEVVESGAPRGRDFARVLEMLSFIAETGEIEKLKALPPERQEAGWNEFWRRRDPRPGAGPNAAMVEFFRRVRYAEQHFQAYGPGWRSDMGRIYIKYGPPQQTETQAEDNGTGTIEIWTYERPLRRFVFEDRDGFGRFVLLSPAFE